MRAEGILGRRVGGGRLGCGGLFFIEFIRADTGSPDAAELCRLISDAIFISARVAGRRARRSPGSDLSLLF